MRTFDFDLALVRSPAFDPDAFVDAVEGPLFETFGGDVTPAVLVGAPYLVCSVTAHTMEGAVTGVVERVAAMGLTALRAEIPLEAHA